MKFASQIFLLVAVGTTLAFSGCTGRTGSPNIELIQDMMDSPALRAQEFDQDGPNHGSMRIPPENTVPVGFEPYTFTDPEVAGRDLKNPFVGDMSQGTLMAGQKYYETNCMICHGMHGEGSEKSSVATFMALKPPTLLSDKVKGWSDGRIYHVITAGQGVMGPYYAHIPQSYRWQVVNYIRFLQNQK